VSVHINEFEIFIYKKTSMEGIEVSDGRIAQDMWTVCVRFIECGLLVYSKFTSFEVGSLCTAFFGPFLSNIILEF
jgi:hypothetical protein